jgi:PAS domain S-box-containing protein
MTRILVVDDKDDNLYYLDVLLKGHGYQVDTARHGAEALVKARQSLPDLVVADLLMPVMDGYTLLRHWKSEKALSAVPFVVYTATYTAPEDEKLALGLGADAFIVKPQEPEALIARIRQVLSSPGKATPKVPIKPVGEDAALIREYSEALVRKLEEKAIQLEAANRALEQEILERQTLAQTQSAILDALPAHIALLDSDGIILAVNEPWRLFARANGLTDPKFGVGSNYLDVCDSRIQGKPGDPQTIADGIRSVLRGEVSKFSFEYPCHTPEKQNWFAAIVNPVQASERRGVLITHIDVTDRALTEITLRKSEQAQQALSLELGKERTRLVEAQAVAKIGSWETDLKTLDVIWSLETFRIFETSPETLSPTHAAFLQFVHPDDRDAVDAAFRKYDTNRDIHTIDHRIVLPGGRIKHLTETWRIFRDEDGTPFRAIGTCQDISDRHAVNEMLRDREARLSRSQEIARVAERVASVGSAAVDFRTGEWEWSDETYRMYGVTRENFHPSAESLATLVHPDDRESLLSNLPAARKGVVPAPLEYRIRRPDGVERILRREATLVRDSDGTVTGIVGTVQDVTERRATERENEMLQRQLRQSQRLEAVGQMTGGIAHDFNNLLTVILGNAETFERHLPKDSPLHELAEITRLAAERGAELTNRLLAFARRQPLDPKSVDIGALIGGMRKLLNRALGEHIQIETICDDGLWRGLVDAAQLESALLNLSVNARDAMPDGGLLTIETRNVELDGTYVVDQTHGAAGGADIVPGQYIMIAVTDGGTGMDEETRMRAFDPFFTTKDVGKGSGLGLSMVYGFVRQSKGHVRIYSEPGHGTTVKLYIPRAVDAAMPSEERLASTSVPGGSEKILVVEDDDLVRNQVKSQLTSLGYNVVIANDGLQALEVLREIDDFDLLFTDVVMPRGMNGRELAEEALKLYPNLPVLFTSGYADNALIHHGRLDAGALLLHKPYRKYELANQIRGILDRAIDARLGRRDRVT